MAFLVPTEFRHEIPCPHCKALIQSPFGAGDLTGTKDAFACPHCKATVAMTLAERVDRIARLEARRGQGWIAGVAILLGLPVARAIIRTPYPILTPMGWLVMIVVGVILGSMAAFVIYHFRIDRVQGRLWQEIEPQRPAELGTDNELDHN